MNAIRNTQYDIRYTLPKPQAFYRPTWVEVDLNAIEYNFSRVKNIVGGKAGILVAVKADAYGHGAYEVSKTLEAAGADYLGVASVDEAIELRKKGIAMPIIILSAILSADAEAVIQYGITQTITDKKTARLIDSAARRAGKTANVHIKIDTGMGRLGAWHNEADILVEEISRLKNIFIEGLYTHFPSAEDTESSFTDEQIRAFNLLIERIERKGIKIPYKHAANSMALISRKNSHLNLVRPGLMIYGMYPSAAARDMVKLKPALSFKTKIVFLKRIPEGRSISYGRTHITKKDTAIATLAVGYADGYNRLLSNKSSILVRGYRAPIVGRVCMDQAMADVGHIKDVKVGDEVTLIGKQNGKTISAEELADLCYTIPYEITCWISKRVPRIYK